MAQTKKLLDIEIQAASYALLSPFVQLEQFQPNPSPEETVQQIFEQNPRFPLDVALLSDVVNVLARFFKASLDSIVQAVTKCILQTYSAKDVALVRLNYGRIKRPKAPKQLRQRQNYTGNDQLCLNFNLRLGKMREEAYNQYNQLLTEFRHCFTPLLQSVVEYEEPVQRAFARFYDQTTAFCKTQIPQVHPSLTQIFAPPLVKLSGMKSHGDYRWSKFQVQIGFSNEGFDAPDLYLKSFAWEAEILKTFQYGTRVFDFSDSLLSRIGQMRILTRKPVPQHHALIDMSGCYVSEELAFYGLLMQLRAILSERGQLTLLDVFFLVSRLTYFGPFRCVIDQRFHGTESRFVRFTAQEPQANTYLKAIGIGGGVRFQMHSVADLAADDELCLYSSAYSVIKQDSQLAQVVAALDELYAAVGYVYGEKIEALVALLSEKTSEMAAQKLANQLSATDAQTLGAEERQVNEESAKNESTREGAEEAPAMPDNLLRVLLLVHFCEQIGQKFACLSQEVTLANVHTMLCENLRFSFPDIQTVEFGHSHDGGELVQPHNALGIISSAQTTITSGNEYVPVLFENMRKCGIFDSVQALAQFVGRFSFASASGLLFKNLFDFFAIQRAFSFFDYQSIMNPTDARVQRLRSSLQFECENVQNVQFCVFLSPYLYPNFAPYVAYNPLLRNCFDLQVEKMLLITQQSVLRHLLNAAAQMPQYPPNELKKLVYRLVQQNKAFNQMVYGVQVDFETYFAEFRGLLCRATYSDVDEAIASFIDVDVHELVRYVGLMAHSNEKSLDCFMECVVAAFKGHIAPPIENKLHITLSDDFVLLLARETFDFVKLLAPLAPKPRVDDKKMPPDANSWPCCDSVGRVCINAGYGALQRMPKSDVNVSGSADEHSIGEQFGEESESKTQSAWGYGFICALSCHEAMQKACQERYPEKEQTQNLFDEQADINLIKSEVIESKIALQDLMGVFKAFDGTHCKE